jgi:integrase
VNKRFEAAVEAVKTHLEVNRYSYSISQNHVRCYHLLKVYLAEKGKSYSKHAAKEWFEGVAADLCKSTANTYRSALEKLDAAYNRNEIGSTKAQYDARQHYQNLAPWCKIHLDDFLVDISSEHGSPYLQPIRIAVARFLDYLNCQGIVRLEDISHKAIAAFYSDDDHDSHKSKDVYNNYIRKFLRYLSARGFIQASIPLALDKFALARLVFIDELIGSERDSFQRCSVLSSQSAETFHEKALEMNAIIEQRKYSKSMRKIFHKAWKELYIFLEANSLHYSIEIALAWAFHMGQYTVQWKSFRRAMMLFEQYRESGLLDPQEVFNYGTDKVDDLPEWCRDDYFSFYRQKEKDGYAKSTLDMFRSVCLRLLSYLDSCGVNAWSDVTPESLKMFHVQDFHSTAEGKNAYSSKIRIFLEHLGEIGRVPPSLFMAVPSESAARMNIIDTLNDDDVADIYRFGKSAGDPMDLRHMAMISIGLRMGIRASDIVKLRFTDISWEQKTISIQQQKTGMFLKLPMSNDVGNALYCYIMHGRPDSSSEYIFISHRVPFNRLNRAVCQKALQKALPANTGGFHITRKTFASRMLISGVQTGRITEALGHVTDQSVMTYLSTDDDNMRLCALSLGTIPVKGGRLA